MIKVTLDNGFTAEIDEVKLDDMHFVELIRQADDDAVKSLEFAEFVLGKDQKEALYKALAEEDGRVPTTKFYDALSEILEKAGESVKN